MLAWALLWPTPRAHASELLLSDEQGSELQLISDSFGMLMPQLLERLTERDEQVATLQQLSQEQLTELVGLRISLAESQAASERWQTAHEETSRLLGVESSSLTALETSYAEYGSTVRDQISLLERRAAVWMWVATGSAVVAVVAIVIAAAR